MADKPRRSERTSEDEQYALALGKIDQYRLLESLFSKVCEEKQVLEKKLSDYQKSRDKDSSGASSVTEPRMRRSFSITQQMLDAAKAQPPEHPTELYQVMEKEKNQEIEILRKKSKDAQRDLKKAQHETDELHGHIKQLMKTMTEKDGRMNELEQYFQDTLTEEERHNHLEREQILREWTQKGTGSSWVVINPPKTSLKNPMLEKHTMEKQDDATSDTVELRKKIDELQGRVTELLNHNEKWNTLCQELQRELDRVRGELQQYQKPKVQQGLAQDGPSEDLKLEMQRRKDAEEMSLKARKQVEELEVKIAQLEDQLKEKERQERQMATEAEELREKESLYKEQIQSYKEDYENEQRDHTITRNQLESQKNQWTTIYKELQEKTKQLTAMHQQLQLLEQNNDELQKQLDQANGDAQLIRDHQKRQQQSTRTPSPEDPRSWECERCTYRNQEAAIVCEMCAAARHHSSLSEPSASRAHTSSTTVTVGRRGIYDTKSFGTAPGMGQLEEDGISCY